MNERRNSLLRGLDFCMGVPLVYILGLLKKLSPARGDIRALQPERIAVLCFGVIGDLLLCTALLSALRQIYPRARIRLFSTKGNAQVFPLLAEDVEIAAYPIFKPAALIAAVREMKPDLVVDTSQWPRIGAVVSALSGAKHSVGFATPGQYRSAAYSLAVPHSRHKHEADNFLALAQALAPDAYAKPGLRIVGEVSENMAELVPFPEKTVFLHCFSAGRKHWLREWQPEKWLAVARHCVALGYMVVFTGSPTDAEYIDPWLEKNLTPEEKQGQTIRSTAGKDNLWQLALLFSRCAAVVSVNTGVAHLAGLAGAPTVDLHGPTSPLRWGAQGPKVLWLQAQGKDAGCLHLGFEYPENAEPVLHNLSAATVIEALQKQLARGPASPTPL